MRRLLPAAALLMMAASCGSVQREESPPEDPILEIPAALFRTADSLTMAGMPEQAEQQLLEVLRSHPRRQDEVLFRLLGIHHGQATESEFLSVLDSLELAWSTPLNGWKISALDLSGRPEQAAMHLRDSDTCLRAWLKWESDSTATLTALPDSASPGQAFCMVSSAPPGSLTRDDIILAAGYARFFPSINERLLSELRSTVDTLGTWRIRLLEEMHPSSGRDLLLAQLMAESDSGNLQYWRQGLEGIAPVAVVAAGELLQRFPGMYSPRWDAADLLVSMGEVALANDYSSCGDAWHRTGTDMAVMLQEKRYDDLLRLSESPGPGAPDSLLARARLYRAHAMRGAGRPAGTCYDAYLEFAREYPWHPFAREAAYNAGKYRDCEQEWDMGAQAYLVSLACAGSFAGDERAHWRGGFCLYMSGRYAQADSLWSLGCSIWPSGYWGDEMMYWRARLADELGETALGDSLRGMLAAGRPWEFYGMLASGRTGSPLIASWPCCEIDLLKDPACSLAVAMTSQGYGVAAAEMLLHGGGGSAEARAAALSLLGRHGGALTLLRALDSELREGGTMLPDSLLFLYFPSPYRALADAATDTLLLESHVLQGIMREESYFDRWVVSSAGARGVVQLMPATAYDVARWYGLPFLREQDFFDPGVSVPYGAIYIDRQYRDFQGQQPLFLAAYNAGPGNAARWVGMHGYDPDDPELYIEQITYRETRIYVKKVLRSAWIYERR